MRLIQVMLHYTLNSSSDIHNFAPFENINAFRDMEVAKGSRFFVSIEDKKCSMSFNGHPKKNILGWLKKALI